MQMQTKLVLAERLTGGLAEEGIRWAESVTGLQVSPLVPPLTAFTAIHSRSGEGTLAYLRKDDKWVAQVF